jgi:FkbH-like protein
MNFLEARKIIEEFQGGPPLSLLVAMSGTGEPLELYIRAAAAARGREARPRFLPFNTLGQALLEPPAASEGEVFVLFPWDLAPELDWRSGVPDRTVQSALLERAAATLNRVTERAGAGVLYVPAPIPPALADAKLLSAMAGHLQALAEESGAELLPPEAFSLASYFGSGLPLGGRYLGDVASRVVDLACRPRREPAKVLVTDLDNTLWRGVIAEDGLTGIAWGADGVGYRHFVYQTYLRRLRAEGVVLAAVSRNSPEVALAPLRGSGMVLGENDFVAVVASYHAKSAQIRELARQLNLDLGAFVFVDDNPVELEEVSLELPTVSTLRFPAHDDGLPDLLTALAARFGRRELTAEDRGRTELYRRRLETMVPQEIEGADLRGFLRDLKMRLVLHDRSSSGRARAVQLINKTNQFNLNGRRVSDDEVVQELAAGGRLLTATLEDRTGSHGEILACLITADGTVVSLVLSCRVFQRRVEHAFCAWLAEQMPVPRAFDFAATDRNEPLQQFLRDSAFVPSVEGRLGWDPQAFAAAHADDLTLFDVVQPVSE